MRFDSTAVHKNLEVFSETNWAENQPTGVAEHG